MRDRGDAAAWMLEEGRGSGGAGARGTAGDGSGGGLDQWDSSVHRGLEDRAGDLDALFAETEERRLTRDFTIRFRNE